MIFLFGVVLPILIVVIIWQHADTHGWWKDFGCPQCDQKFISDKAYMRHWHREHYR